MPFDNPVPVEVTPVTILDNMLQRLATPDKWCQRSLVEFNILGEPVSSCILGAIQLAECGKGDRKNQGLATGLFRQIQSPAAKEVYLRLHRAIGDVVGFNDNPKTTHADVMHLLSRTRDSFAGGSDAV